MDLLVCVRGRTFELRWPTGLDDDGLQITIWLRYLPLALIHAPVLSAHSLKSSLEHKIGHQQNHWGGMPQHKCCILIPDPGNCVRSSTIDPFFFNVQSLDFFLGSLHSWKSVYQSVQLLECTRVTLQSPSAIMGGRGRGVSRPLRKNAL